MGEDVNGGCRKKGRKSSNNNLYLPNICFFPSTRQFPVYASICSSCHSDGVTTCLSRSFSDAAVGTLLDLLESKVPRQGGMLLKVDRFFPSSQLCHCCGTRKEDLTLADRHFVCPNLDCGYVGDRDENAALNLILYQSAS